MEQYACPTTVPVHLLEPAGGDRYTIRSLHPVLGHGCLGVDAGLRTEGARLMNRTPGAAAVQLPCTQAQSGRLFAFDPVPAATAVPDIRSN
ncbi:hypothetical protein ABZ621_17130 [Streptomyces sp. NPDC007863]|uniref:hypothetical protein n=1 Tax=Streptomyces sp. NPDC007863 TaxID=3154894 RepID=UPI0033F7AE25